MQRRDENSADISREEFLRFLDAGASTQTRARNEGGSGEPPSPGCPHAASYMRLVLGMARGREADHLLEHATRCEACASLMAAGLKSLDGNPSPEEAAALAELAAAKAPWQGRLAKELAATAVGKQPLFRFGTRGWIVASAAAVLLIAIAGLSLEKSSQSPERLLASAYEKSRTFELRIPSARYSTIAAGDHTRGLAPREESAPLLEARAKLTEQLQKTPQDPHLLELQARADVLEEQYDEATDVLDRLLVAGQPNSEMLLDAATAYYQRGLITGRELDRSKALDYLRRADELAPKDPVVLYNEAIVMEDRGQIINAVEVWNRYIAVENNDQWAAEGKRKLAALEQTLNKLKSHDSRTLQMLATPEAMNALAGDATKLANLDEELSSIQIDRLLLTAFPATSGPGPESKQARGSPCTEMCLAARKLLQATASSIEKHHHDFWLSNLLLPRFDSLPISIQNQYTEGIRALALATREDQTGAPARGVTSAKLARTRFEKLYGSAGTNQKLHAAFATGVGRSEVEEIFALQRNADYIECRQLGTQLDSKADYSALRKRSPWIDAVTMVTEHVCADTSDTRDAGAKKIPAALLISEAARYSLLQSRVRLHVADIAHDIGNDEAAAIGLMSVLRDLLATDAPSVRIENTVAELIYGEQDSTRARVTELYNQELMHWYEIAGDQGRADLMRMNLAGALLRIDKAAAADSELQQFYQQNEHLTANREKVRYTIEPSLNLARLMLERGDGPGAARVLNIAQKVMPQISDLWIKRRYTTALGQLQLAGGNNEAAARTLGDEIADSEGESRHVHDKKDPEVFTEQDHDLYGELVATWLAEGRPAEEVLGLWERFRLRNRSLPRPNCSGMDSVCWESALKAERLRMGSDILIGQVVLLDRVLVYRMDRNKVQWSVKKRRRQNLLDAAQDLEFAVSSPSTSTATAEQLGAGLSDAFLPSLPDKMSDTGVVLLEPDPLLEDLSWPVLPTGSGPLGVNYPLTELDSILARSSKRPESKAGHEDRQLVIGASIAGGEAPPLPEALREAEDVNRYLHASTLLVGNDATSDRVGEAIGKARILHFAGHAVQTVDGPRLLLADLGTGTDPWIDSAFLRKYPPHECQLAVLSGCSTGKHESSWNAPLPDLADILEASGVPAVVATRWQLNSEAAVPFMDRMYRSLQEGRCVAAALQDARAFQFRDPAHNKPYFWGAFYLTGREDRQLKDEFAGKFN